MTLLDLELGKPAVVKQIQANCHDVFLEKRLLAIGIIPNKPIQIIRKAYFGGPLHIRVGSTTEIALRRREAKIIEVCQPDAI